MRESVCVGGRERERERERKFKRKRGEKREEEKDTPLFIGQLSYTSLLPYTLLNLISLISIAEKFIFNF
jgi:hypothetical protein